MSDELNSQLSAFVDDELAPEESELLVRRLCRDEVLRNTAASYAVIGDVLRDEMAITAPPDFVTRVMMAVEGQIAPPIEAPAVAGGRSIRNWGVALAASVALAAVAMMTLPTFGPEEKRVVNNDIEPQVETRAAPAPTVAANRALALLPVEEDVGPIRYDVPRIMPANRYTVENQARLNNLLLRHLSTTGATTQGLVSYRNVGFVTQAESER